MAIQPVRCRRHTFDLVDGGYGWVCLLCAETWSHRDKADPDTYRPARCVDKPEPRTPDEIDELLG